MEVYLQRGGRGDFRDGSALVQCFSRLWHSGYLAGDQGPRFSCMMFEGICFGRVCVQSVLLMAAFQLVALSLQVQWPGFCWTGEFGQVVEAAASYQKLKLRSSVSREAIPSCADPHTAAGLLTSSAVAVSSA